MHLSLLAAALLATPGAEGKCTPAAPDVVAAAEREAAAAETRANEAESIAVRSGNPGAEVRAGKARADATAAQDQVARLRCRSVEKPRPTGKIPGRGY